MSASEQYFIERHVPCDECDGVGVDLDLFLQGIHQACMKCVGYGHSVGKIEVEKVSIGSYTVFAEKKGDIDAENNPSN